MRTSRLDLPPAQRLPIASVLNLRLAELLDLGLQLKQAHWNVRGPQFIALHHLFDELSGPIAEAADDVAERIVALGGVAEGTAQTVASRTSLPVYGLGLVAEQEHIAALADSVAQLARAVRADIDRVTELGDAGTADLLTGLSRTLDQQLWFLEAHEPSKA